MARKEDTYSQLLDCSCNMIRRSARKVTQLYESSLREAGIRPTQFTILAALANTGPILLTQLADTLLLDRTGLTRNLNVLERNGWIQLQIGEGDARQRVVSLTTGGYEQLDVAIPYWQKAQTSIESDMGKETITGLRKTLNEMTDTIID